MTETLMTETPPTTNEGDAASQPAATPGTAPEQNGQQQQAAGEQTAPESKADEGASSDEGEAKPEGAPEKYEWKAPEGKTYDPEMLSAYEKVARSENMSQEAAQRVLDGVASAFADRQLALIETTKTAWADSAKADKEFGGAKFSENLAVAKKALDTFGTPELRSLLKESGLGNHPELIRAFYRAGQAISEDRVVRGAQQGGKPAPKGFADYANNLYPSQPH